MPPPADRRSIALLGSTGSIGTQAVDVVQANPDRFRIVALAAGGGRVDLLADQAAALGVQAVAVAEPGAEPRAGVGSGRPRARAPSGS